MALVTSGSDLTVIVLDHDEVDALSELLSIDREVPAGLNPGLLDRLGELTDALDAHFDGRD